MYVVEHTYIYVPLNVRCQNVTTACNLCIVDHPDILLTVSLVEVTCTTRIYHQLSNITFSSLCDGIYIHVPTCIHAGSAGRGGGSQTISH